MPRRAAAWTIRRWGELVRRSPDAQSPAGSHTYCQVVRHTFRAAHQEDGRAGDRPGRRAPARRPSEASPNDEVWLDPQRWSGRSAWVLRMSANVVGAAGAAYFAWASVQFYARTHRLIGAILVIEQSWVVIAYLVRRPTRAVTRRMGDW